MAKRTVGLSEEFALPLDPGRTASDDCHHPTTETRIIVDGPGKLCEAVADLLVEAI
jgi:hypothetical protein